MSKQNQFEENQDGVKVNKQTGLTENQFSTNITNNELREVQEKNPDKSLAECLKIAQQEKQEREEQAQKNTVESNDVFTNGIKMSSYKTDGGVAITLKDAATDNTLTSLTLSDDEFKKLTSITNTSDRSTTRVATETRKREETK